MRRHIWKGKFTKITAEKLPVYKLRIRAKTKVLNLIKLQLFNFSYKYIDQLI